MNVRRVGHSGTLDPFATGLLVVLVGRATRLSQFLVVLRKKYMGTLRLGVSTDTHDLTGEVTEENDGWQTLENGQIVEAMAALVGRQEQQPPKYSAKKVGGQRAYRLARKGEAVDLPPKEIEVYDFAATNVAGAEVQFQCDVSSGTYVRALARDLGADLGCGAHLTALRRISVGDFDVDRAQKLDEIDGDTVTICSPAEAVGHMKQVVIESEEVRQKIGHGQPIPAAEHDADIVALMADNELIAIAERKDDMFKPRVVMEEQS